MAALDIAPHFGAELKDGFKTVNAWVTNGVSWLDDIQQFYRERSVIEKEYSAKLNALAKKYYEKKIKRSSSLSVGDTPTQTPGSLESASMTTWSIQLTTLESRAAEHDKYASEITMNLAEPLKHLAARCEDLRKQHSDYAAKLEKERDNNYGELKKQKGKYDSTCQELENRRKKIESSYDQSKPKAQSAYQQQQSDMQNTKNTYLIAINVTNKQKEMYYQEYIPDLLDSLQDLSESRCVKMNNIWARAAAIETATLARSVDLMKHLSAEIPRNNPVLDSMMFVRHNVATWQEPSDFVFEPSPVWLDDDAMAQSEAAKVFLRNMLVRSKGQLGELRREVDTKRKNLQMYKTAKVDIREGRNKKDDEVELVRSIFILQGELHEAERRKVTAEVEAASILTVVGDSNFAAQSHNFKSQTFKIPTNCDLCGERIWGLSAKGFDCRDCGFTCHSKCEMKVPPDCPGESTKDERRALKARRQEDAAHGPVVEAPIPDRVASSSTTTTMPKLSRTETLNSLNTLSSGYAASAHRSVSGQSLQSYNEEPAENVRPMVAKPTPTGRRTMAPPPMAYVSTGSNGNGNSVSSSAASSEKKVRMLYPYQKNGDGEVSVDEGVEAALLEPDGTSPLPQPARSVQQLTRLPDGSGWIKIRTSSGTGLVPASYTESVASTASPHTAFARLPSTGTTSIPTRFSASSTSLTSSLGGGSGGPKKQGPAVAPRRGAKKVKYVEAMYAYEARAEAEISVSEGERVVLVQADQGDGWCEVEKGGRVGSVPASYVREV